MPVTLNVSQDNSGKNKYALENDAAEAAYVAPTYSTTCRMCGKRLGTESASARIGQCYECSQAEKLAKYEAEHAEEIEQERATVEPRAAKAAEPVKVKQARRPKGSVTPEEKRAAAAARKRASRANNPAANAATNRKACAAYRATHQDERRTYRADYNARRAAALAALQAGIITPESEQVAAEIVEAVKHVTVTGMAPSSYQQAIYDWVAYGSGNAIVGAVAGAGKTTTLVTIAQLIHVPAAFFAFNKHTADELKGRLAGTTMSAQTIHSYGNMVVANGLGVKVQNMDKGKYKYSDLIKAAAFEIAGYDKQRQQLVKDALKKLVDFCRLCLVNPKDANSIEAMMDHYDIFVPDAYLEAACIEYTAKILDQGIEIAKKSGLIDFTDMIWLPVVLNLPCPKTPWVLVDECQDLNKCQLELVLKACSGRMIAVGDENQSMYGFAGADCDSFRNIQYRTSAQYFPLSICYRCPRKVVEVAQTVVSSIEYAPNAPDGVVEWLPEAKGLEMLQAGDMVLCRLTAPLVKTCIELIKQRRQARVKGRDIAHMLTDIVKSVVSMTGYEWVQFGTYLEYYENDQRARLLEREHPEAAIESLQDRVSAVQTCYEGWQCDSAQALIEAIEGLFSDAEGFITLSTVHRAKGLEVARVFILQPEKMPLVWQNQQEWEAIQEQNIKYVALTRAKEAMYFLESTKKAA